MSQQEPEFELDMAENGVLQRFRFTASSRPDLMEKWKFIMTESQRITMNALTEMERRKDAAYLERNRLVALLARIFPSGIAKTAIEGWSDDWHNCVYIDTRFGQLSWHYHDSHANLFEGLPPYTKSWDGHTTEEKYERIEQLMKSLFEGTTSVAP